MRKSIVWMLFFDLIIYVPANNFSVMSGLVFLGWTSTMQGLMCLALRTQRNDAGLGSSTLPLSYCPPYCLNANKKWRSACTFTPYFENSMDPDQLKPDDQDLCCFSSTRWARICFQRKQISSHHKFHLFHSAVTLNIRARTLKPNQSLHHAPTLNVPRREKTCLWMFVNIKVADQPAHPHRLVSTFVICFLESIISRQANFQFSS